MTKIDEFERAKKHLVEIRWQLLHNDFDRIRLADEVLKVENFLKEATPEFVMNATEPFYM